jgi:hypothetical protein
MLRRVAPAFLLFACTAAAAEDIDWTALPEKAREDRLFQLLEKRDKSLSNISFALEWRIVNLSEDGKRTVMKTSQLEWARLGDKYRFRFLEGQWQHNGEYLFDKVCAWDGHVTREQHVGSERVAPGSGGRTSGVIRSTEPSDIDLCAFYDLLGTHMFDWELHRNIGPAMPLLSWLKLQQGQGNIESVEKDKHSGEINLSTKCQFLERKFSIDPTRGYMITRYEDTTHGGNQSFGRGTVSVQRSEKVGGVDVPTQVLFEKTRGNPTHLIHEQDEEFTLKNVAIDSLSEQDVALHFLPGIIVTDHTTHTRYTVGPEGTPTNVQPGPP